MTYLDALGSMLLDPFRIGLLIALVLTMRRTAQATGTWLPLAAGAVFVAVIIPMTLSAPTGGMMLAVALGLLANALILGVILLAMQLWQRRSL